MGRPAEKLKRVYDSTVCRDLIGALKPLGVKWGCQIGLDVTAEPDLETKMAQYGFVAVLVGFESLVPENLKQMGKAWNGSLIPPANHGFRYQGKTFHCKHKRACSVPRRPSLRTSSMRKPPRE